MKTSEYGDLREPKRLWLVLALLVLYLLLAFVWQDLPLWDFDDAMYLASAQTVHAWMFVHGLTTMPGYALWLRGVGVVFRDPVWCQFGSWVLMVTAIAMVPVVAGVRRAWLCAVVLLAMPYFRVGPYVSLFAAMVLVAGAVVLLRARKFSYADAALLACAASFVVAYARPEYSYGVLLAAAATVLVTLVERRKRNWLLAALPAVLLCVAMVYVVKHSDTSRSGVAFAQHYNLRAAAHGVIPEQGAWDSEYAYRVFGIDVHANGGRHTLGEFAKANPRLFAGHVLHNVLSPFTAVMVVFTLMVCAWPWFRKEHEAQRAVSLYVLLIALPTFVSMALVFPDKHYMQIVLPSLLLLAVQFVPEPGAAAVRGVSVVAAVLVVAFALRGTPVAHGHLAVRKPGLDTIACLRGVERDVPAENDVMFDAVGIRTVYLLQPKTTVTTETLPDWATMEAAEKERRPGWVVLSPGAAGAMGTTLAEARNVLVAQERYAVKVCPKASDVVVFTAR